MLPHTLPALDFAAPQVFKNDVNKAVGTLADMLTAPKLDEQAIERERNVILREAEEVASQQVRWTRRGPRKQRDFIREGRPGARVATPRSPPPPPSPFPPLLQEEVIFDLLHSTAYQDSGLGRTILGPEANIRSITRGDLEAYIRSHYTGGRIVVAGAGAVDHDALVKIAEQTFGGLPASPAGGLIAAPEPARFVGSEIRQRDDDLGLAHVAVSFETGGWTSPNAFPLMIMQTLLGNWDRTLSAGPNMASPLCRKVGEQGLAHSLSTFNTTYKDSGLFGVYAVAEPTKLWELMATVMYETVRLAHNVTEDEVARARTQLKAALLGSLDGSTAVCEDIGRQMLTYGRRMTPAEILARIDAVDAAAVKAAADAYVNDKDVAVAGVGHIHELPGECRGRRLWGSQGVACEPARA